MGTVNTGGAEQVAIEVMESEIDRLRVEDVFKAQAINRLQDQLRECRQRVSYLDQAVIRLTTPSY